MNVEVNWLAIILGAISTMAVGTVWYSKGVFGTVWGKLVKLDDKKMKAEAPKALALAFVLSLILSFVMAHFIFIAHTFFGNSWLQDALSTAFWLWLGVAFTRVVTHDAFEQRRKKLTLLNIANMLVTMLVVGAIIGLLHP